MNATANTLQLPEPLQERFRLLEKRLWRMDTIIAICGSLCGLIISFTLLYISDRFWDTPRWLRLLATAIGLGVLGYFVWGWLKLWVWKRRDYRALSRLVQRHYRRLGDRLLGIVELADETKRPPNISPALCDAAIQQVSREAVAFDFGQAVASRKPKIYFIAAVFLLALIAFPLILTPQASLNVLSRWLAPVSRIPRYTFVTLDQLPSMMIVPHGEPFEITCGVNLRSIWRPSSAAAQFEQQPPIQAPIVGREVIFKVPGQTKAGQLTLRVGDIQRRIRVEPTLRPALKKLMAKVELPSYLQYPPAQEEIRNGVLSYLEGSEVSFSGTATRALASAGIAAPTNAPSRELKVSAEQFVSPPMKLDGLAQCAFTWMDSLGLKAAAPWPLALQAQKDAPPQVELPEQPAVIAMLEEELIDFKLEAQDDFGVKELSLAWESQKRGESNVLAQKVLQVKAGTPQGKTLGGNYRFSPALLHIPADTIVSFRGLAVDYLPSRKPAESQVYKIYVLSREEHAKLIEQQFEKIAGELEELTRRQEGLQENTRETRNTSPEKMRNEETGKKLGEQATEQKDLAEKLKRLENMTAETMKEAMRNKSIPSETMREWSQHMEKMKDIAQQKMPQASQSLSSAQKNPQQRESQMDQAMQKQQEIIKELQDMQKQIGQTLDTMLANTLAQRLRKVAQTQQEVGGTLQKVVPETIGLMAENVPAALLDKTKRAALEQEGAGKQTQQLAGEISRFHDRTGVTNYGNVAKEMKQTEASEALARNAELIRRNIAMQAIQQTAEWNKQFLSWAEQLEAGKEEGGGGSGSSGQGKPNEAALKRLLALLRLRLDEVNVRESTRWLEEHKKTHPSYNDDAVSLSLRQSLLVDEAEALDKSGKSRFLYDAREAMEEADKFLRKPQTDKPAIESETDAINLLEAEIMEMVKQPNQSPQQAQAMAMMMQMMGMQANPQGGGNFAGGEARPSDMNPNGDPRGRGSEARNNERTAGRESRTVPTEFREALQNYYKAIEQLNP